MNISNKDKIAVKKLLNVADRINNCTKCMVKPIVKEHMCEKCYTEHNEWLRNQSKSIRTGDYLAKNHKWHTVEDLEKAMDSDQWYTLYESGVKG